MLVSKHKSDFVWWQGFAYASACCDCHCCAFVREADHEIRVAMCPWIQPGGRQHFQASVQIIMFVHCVFLETTYQQTLTAYSCLKFVLARAAGGRNRGVLYTDQGCSCCIAMPVFIWHCLSLVNKILMLQAVSTKAEHILQTWWPFFSSISADSPSHVGSNRRNQTTRPLKNNSSLLPISGNAPVKKHSVQQDNPLALKTGRTLS